MTIAVLQVDSLLGHRISEIFRRTCIVYEISSSMMIRGCNGEIDISESSLMHSFMTLYHIEVLCITFDETQRQPSYEKVGSLIECARQLNVKIVFIGNIKNSEIKIDTFNPAIDLIINTGEVYGYANGINSAERQDNEGNTTQNQGLLIDEVSLWLANNIDKTGEYNLDNEGNRLIEEYTPYDSKEQNVPKFNNQVNGLEVVNRQRGCVFNLVYKLKPQDNFFDLNIAKWRYELGKKLSNTVTGEVKHDIDFISPVPNTGRYYAMGVAAGLSIPYIQCLEKWDADIRSFQIIDTDRRKGVLWSKIKPIEALIRNKSVALVDEAIFTGTTLKVVCQMMRECGAKKVFLLIPTPMCSNECDYYVMPRRKMLLEYINKESLNQYFDVDGIQFLPYEVFQDSLNDCSGKVCTECFREGF